MRKLKLLKLKLKAEASNSDKHDDTSFDNVCVDNCPKYEYKNKESSIVSKFDLACGGRKSLNSLSNSIYWVGYFISCFVTGALSDRFGRKWVSFGLLIGLTASTTLNAFASCIYLYITCRFIVGFCVLTFALDFLILSESVEKSRFALVAITSSLFIFTGEFSCITVGYIFENSWKLQLIVMAVPAFLYIPLHFFLMPESGRWLHSVGRFEESQKRLREIAKINKKDPCLIDFAFENENSVKSESISNVSVDIFERKRSTQNSENVKKASLLDLFRTFHTSMLTLTCALTWFSCSLVFYGLTYIIGSIGGNLYINAYLISSTEIPAWTVLFAMDKFGRQKTAYMSLFICAISCAVIPFTKPILDGKLQIGFAMIGRCLVTASFNSLYAYTPEQFPTVVRSTGFTFCSSFARVASISAPFIIQLEVGPYNSLPFLIFAASGFISSVFVFCS